MSDVFIAPHWALARWGFLRVMILMAMRKRYKHAIMGVDRISKNDRIDDGWFEFSYRHIRNSLPFHDTSSVYKSMGWLEECLYVECIRERGRAKRFRFTPLGQHLCRQIETCNLEYIMRQADEHGAIVPNTGTGHDRCD